MSQTPHKSDPKKTRQAARKLIGQAGLERLAEHDAALVYHAGEIERLRGVLDGHIQRSVDHASVIDSRHDDMVTLVTHMAKKVGDRFAAGTGLRRMVLRWLFPQVAE